jgi:hypothetical protein
LKFEEMHELIPHALGEKLHVVTMQPYNGVTLAMPGRHQKDTPVPGGDFVVMVSDSAIDWVNHQFTHDNIFNDIYKKTQQDGERAKKLLNNYARVVFGTSPDDYKWDRGPWKDSLHPQIFLHATQALAVAEHRRYSKHENRGGGRYLPLRFAYGIVHGAWTPKEAKVLQRKGRPGLEMLENEKNFSSSLVKIQVFLDGGA